MSRDLDGGSSPILKRAFGAHIDAVIPCAKPRSVTNMFEDRGGSFRQTYVHHGTGFALYSSSDGSKSLSNTSQAKGETKRIPKPSGVPRRHPRFTYDGKTLRDAMKHCVDMVKDKDYEFYQWCSQLPLKEQRAPVFVLKALALEIESIQRQARTEMLLKMRYQWWRDSVGKAFAAKNSYEMSQPVMKALSELIQCHEISKHRVDTMIDAYEEDALRSKHMLDIQQVEEYSQGTVSQLLSLQLESCGLNSDDSEHAAMSSLGKAIGLASGLRHAEIYLREGKSYFPEDICRKYNATPIDFMGQDGLSVLPQIVEEVASVACAHLQSAAAMRPGSPFHIQALSTELYLDALKKAKYDIFSKKMHRGGYLPIEYLVKMKWRFLMSTKIS